MLRSAMIATALIVTGSLSAAACDPPTQSLGSAPSRLDYLLLASLADSQQLLSMAAYRPNR